MRPRYYNADAPDDDPSSLIGHHPIADPRQTKPVSTDLRGLLARAGYRVVPPHTGSIAVAAPGKRAT